MPRTLLLLIVLSSPFAFAQPARHPLKLDDLARIREVRDPQCSPDGKWVAYVVGTIDAKEDKHDSDIWMVSYDGSKDLRLTSSPDAETSPRWSSDGKYLTFLSSRTGPTRGNQVWILDREGGEASQLTAIKGRLQSYEWSPDAKRLALIIGDPDPDADAAEGSGGAAAAGGRGGRGGAAAAPKPIVIDRYHFKQDGQGYLTGDRHSHIYLFDVATKKLDQLTKGTYDESSPVWSPDGSRIAFLSDHAKDVERNPAQQVYVIEANIDATEKQITPLTVYAERGRPEWSPDGKWIAFTAGDETKWIEYNMARLMLVPADGSSAPVMISDKLDRPVSAVLFAPGGKTIMALVADDRSVHPVEFDIATHSFNSLLADRMVISSPTHVGGCGATLVARDDKATEVYAVDPGPHLRQLTHQNDELFSELDLGKTEEVSFKSADGTEVHGLLTKPVGYVEGTKVPLLLRIHGGPNGQDAHAFSVEHQVFAANGYAVLAVNYRGSSGRGTKFQRAIFADWGHYEVEDLKAGVDHVIKMGVADPDRLGVGGWSYGAILTDYMIASDTRFKAATSGAGTAFAVSFYGTDQYILQYDYEIGPPWNPKAWDTYVKISYPFLHADRIKTPTLFLGGERDFDVPVQGGQQMYQALKSLGIDTQLIIYPNETHGIQRPSYVKDRYERYLVWYDKYLKKSAPAATGATAANAR